MRRLLAALGVCLLSAGAGSAAQSQSPTLAGTWKLNREASDDPNERMQEAREPAPDAETGMGRGGRPRTSTSVSRSGGSGSRPSVGGGGGGGGAMGGGVFIRVLRPAAQMTVEQNDTIVIIRDEGGIPQVIYLDNRKVEEPAPGGELMQVTAKWKDGKLTVERKSPTTSIKEVFTLDAAKRRIVVDAKLTSAQMQGAVSIRRVYDAGS